MINIIKEIKELKKSIVKVEDNLNQLRTELVIKPDIAYLKKRLSEYVEEKPQTIIYVGDEDYYNFFKHIANTFGISKSSYSARLVDGEWEIIVK